MGLFKKEAIIALLIFFVSCSEREQENNSNENDRFNCKEFYSDGRVKSLGDTINGKYEGLYKEFYPNGNIRYINFYKRGLLNGHIQEFFENGNPKIDMYYIMNKPMGVQYIFFESDSARVRNKFIVSRYKDKEVLVSRIEFNERGDTISDESRVKVYLAKDTFDIGDKISMELTLNYPVFKNHRVHIGNFDRTLSLIDSIGYQTYEGLGNKASIEFSLNRKGKNVIRGYMEDFEIEKKNPDGSYTTIGTLNNWFDVEIFVK